MTVQELPGAAAYRPTPPPAWKPITDPAPLLPDPEPYRVLGTDAVADVDPELLLRLHAELVRGRRYNTPGHRADQAGPSGGLPVEHRPGGVRDRRRPGA
ncbi:hypothetical protein SMICM17S_07628 [Streptomyces microflavus]